MSNKWIDITVPLKNGMIHWPGDTPFKQKFIKKIGRNSSCNLSNLDMGAHSGTHMDAPLHFIPGGDPVDKIPLDKCIGPARVIAIKDKKEVTLKELKTKKIRKGERILFKTKNSKRLKTSKKFIKDFVYISLDAAKYLKEKQIKLVGIDYFSVGGTTPESKGRGVHKALLSSGTAVVEGLDLSKVKEGRYNVICLPLNIEGAEGSPVRCILRKEQ